MSNSSLIRKIVLAGFLGTVLSMFAAVPTNAADNVLPDPNPMPSALVVVARNGTSSAGGTFALDATEAVYKGFSFNSSSTTLTFDDFCNSSYGWGNWGSRVDIYRNTANESISTLAGTITTSSCSSSDPSFNLSGLTRSTIQGHESYFTYTVIARHTQSGGGINGFRIIQSTSGVVSFADEPGRATSTAPGNRPFAVLDRGFVSNPRGEHSYSFFFAADCNVTAARTVYLKWSDADYGRVNEVGTTISFMLVDVTTGATVLSRSGSQLNTTGVNNDYGFVGFTIQPNHKYRWTWNGVDNNNGVQLWIPYSEVNFFQDCGEFDYRASIGLNRTTARPGDTIRATHTNTNVGDAAGPGWLRAIHVPTGGSYVTRVTNWGNDSGDMARQYGVAGIGPGVSGSRAADYTVGTNVPDGSQVCFYARVATSSPATTHSSARRCVTIDNPRWNYTINRSGSPAPSATFPKPGNNITISSRVENNGDGAGAAYEHRFVVTRGGELLVDSSNVRFTGQAGLAAGSGRTRSAIYQIRNDASHGGEVCFMARVSPYQGLTYPLPPSATSSGWRDSDEICYTVYNLRFELENDPNIGFNLTSGSGAGESVPVSYSINNGDAGELPAGASGGPTPNLNARAQITTGNASLNPSGMSSQNTGQIAWGGAGFQRSFDIVIGNNAEVGDEVCLRVFVNWEQGYSDGTSLTNNPEVDDTQCFDVNDGPYLQVLGHDSWAGGAYSLDGSCSAVGSGHITSLTRDSLVSSGTTVGALDEYAAFANGNLNNFGTADDAGGSSLTFANTGTPLGQFGAQRCLANLFDNGGSGGQIDDALWANATDVGNNFNGFNTLPEGQYRINGSAVHSNAGTPFNDYSKNATVLINGDFEIRQDITLNSSFNSSNVPFVLFIVTGDIRIQDIVRRMDGMYISLGTIDTCNSWGGASLSPITPLTADGDCRDHLLVNGSLIANEIAFRRTHGGTNEAATGNNLDRCLSASAPHFTDINRRCSAETIIFPPWFYLAEPHFDRSTTSSENNYPIQQLRDLPPIF